MKNLRQLLRRSGWLRSQQRPGRPQQASRSNVSRRRLSNEALERRELLAGDLLASNHNYWHPYDVNDDGQYSARDALAIINYMSRNGSAAGEMVAESEPLEMFYDVNADNRVTAADALGVINAMSRGEGVGELVELLLNARTDNDQLIAPDANGDINIPVNQPFDLEISYNELRFFDDRLGIFQLFTDISVSQPNVLEPVLNETQRLIVGEEIRQNNSGSLTFSIEGSATTYVSQFIDFATNSRQEIVNALTAFGYSSSEYTLRSLDFGTDDIGFEVHFVGDEFGDLDLPDITLTGNFPVPVPTQTVEFAPRNPDGSINSDAVRFNVNSLSRTFNNNEKFYSTNNRGLFDPTVGVTDFGGIGQVPVDGGGIPDLTDDGNFITPFDAFSLRVKLTQAVTDFVVGVTPALSLNPDPTVPPPDIDESVLLFGRDDPLTADLVLIDDDATVTFNAIAANQDPVVSAPVSATFNEDQGQQTVDLLQNASDPDGDSLSISNPMITGDQAGISVNGSTVTVTPGAYGSLNDGESAVINFSYNVLDGNGGSVAQTATITITGITDVVNQPPVVSAPISVTFNEDQGQQIVNLLQNASDPDGDTLNISGLTLRAGSGDASGISPSGNTLVVTPSVYDALNDGESVVLIYDYNVTDGALSVATSATITITGITDNRDPVVGNPISATFNEDQGQQMVNLLTGASDPDGDTLSITTPTITGDQSGISVNGSTVTVTPGAYGDLNDGQSSIINFSYNVIDGNGGSTAQTATITITGITDIINQPPVISAPISVTFNEDQANQIVNLLANATDPENDTLTVNGLTLRSGDASGITTGASTLSVNPGAYDALNDGESVVVIYDYNVTDGEFTIATSATVTITGITDNRAPVVAGPLTATFSEQDASASINLLQGATDADGDTLNVTNLTLVSGDDSGITTGGNTLGVNPDAYGSLVDNQSAVVVYSYNVSDGDLSASQSLTITINGFNDPPRARDDNNVIAFVDTTQNITVLANDDAGEGEEGQALTVISATSNDGNATVTPNANGTVAFTPDAGFIGATSFTYTVQDAGGKQSTATVNVTVQDFNPSSVSGAIFIDEIDNIRAVIKDGADPIRSGHKESHESGLGSVHIRLHSDANDNSTGQTITVDTLTNLHGGYTFEGIAPGSYSIMAMIDGSPLSSTSDKVIYLGPSELHVGIDIQGGASVTQQDFALLGTAGSALNTVDILASSYLRNNPGMSNLSNGGREGGLVSLATDGSQNFFIAGEGFDGVTFGELVLNEDRDAALLTIVEEDGDVMTARLSSDHFVVSEGNGLGVQFFGGLDDFDFIAASNNSAAHAEFANYLDAVDKLFGSN